MLKASEAKQASKAYYNKLVSDHAVEYKKIMAREHKETERVWALRGDTLVAQIEGYIKKASKEGGHVTFAPSDINPNGDEVIWLDDADRPIHKKLMDYFRKNGFTVVEYAHNGMKITW
jgi:hypothetical protein